MSKVTTTSTEVREIHLEGRRKSKAVSTDRCMIRVTPEAYNTLLDIAEETPLSLMTIVSQIIIQASPWIVYDREGE